MPGLQPWFPQVNKFYLQDDAGAPDSSAAPPPPTAWPVERAQEAIRAFEADAGELPPIPDDDRIMDELLRNALLLFENGEIKLAINLFRNALMRDPRHSEALRWMACCQRIEGRLDDALKCARALAQLRPDEDAAWFLLGETLYEMGRDEEARRALERSLTLASAERPFLFDIYKFIGNACVRSGDFDAAEENYNRAFALNPASDALMVNYGTLELQREQTEAAIERFRQAVAINAQNDRAWVGLALVHRNMGDASLAWANVEKALDADPANRTALGLVVEWGALDGDFEPAVRRLKHYLGAQGDDSQMSYSLARILAATGRLDEAAVELERSVALDPSLEGAEELRRAVRDERRRVRARAAA